MKKDLVNILCCPTCKGDLKLKVEKEENGEIITGSFTCEKCKCTYSIEGGIPDLLPK
ncbi:MAG: methytransferase partner Trm112 [Thermoplasmatales archaeon]|nr:methytransferase partner Trm112 [Thermoplasmatales archaeon]